MDGHVRRAEGGAAADSRPAGRGRPEASAATSSSAPKKGYVSVRRARQFAILQPSTKDRFDLGLNLKGDRAGRAAGSLGQLQRDGQPPASASPASTRSTARSKRWLEQRLERA